MMNKHADNDKYFDARKERATTKTQIATATKMPIDK